MVKKTTKKQPLTLHSLLGALSFWGTATRTFLFSFLAAAVLVVALTEAVNAQAVDTEIMVFIYVIGSFLLLDFGYVMVARTYTLSRALDVLGLVAADVLVALLYIVPNLVVNPNIVLRVDPLTYVVFVPLIVIALRMLLGILFGSRQR